MFEEVHWGDGRRRLAAALELRRRTAAGLGLRNALRGAVPAVPLAQLARCTPGRWSTSRRSRSRRSTPRAGRSPGSCGTREGGRYRPTLRRILTEAADGTLFPGEAIAAGPATASGTRESARPLLEHYLKADLEQLDKAFRQYVTGSRTGTGRVEGWTELIRRNHRG